MRTVLAFLLTLVTTCHNLPVRAGTVYTNRASFNAAVSGFTLETFESSPLSGAADGGAVSSMTFPLFTITTEPAAIKIMGTSVSGAHNTTAVGNRYLYLDTDMGGVGASTTFMSFATPITGFGFDLTDLDADDAIIQIPGQIIYTSPIGLDGDARFWGFVSSEPFSSINLTTGTDSSVGIDNVVVVPEPNVSFLISVLLAGVFLGVKCKSVGLVSYSDGK